MRNATLYRSKSFVRTARKFLKRRPELTGDLADALRKLETNPYHPSLKTHKLTGELDGSWACSAGYDLRIIFRFGKHAGQSVIILETVGTHDEVY